MRPSRVEVACLVAEAHMVWTAEDLEQLADAAQSTAAAFGDLGELLRRDEDLLSDVHQ